MCPLFCPVERGQLSPECWKLEESTWRRLKQESFILICRSENLISHMFMCVSACFVTGNTFVQDKHTTV